MGVESGHDNDKQYGFEVGRKMFNALPTEEEVNGSPVVSDLVVKSGVPSEMVSQGFRVILVTLARVIPATDYRRMLAAMKVRQITGDAGDDHSSLSSFTFGFVRYVLLGNTSEGSRQIRSTLASAGLSEEDSNILLSCTLAEIERALA